MKFSIIVPCYNCVSFFQRTYNSIANQTLRDFELILIDDCSKDGTYEFLKKLQASSKFSVVVERNKQNCGPGETRNHAMKLAKGEFFLFLDSDDWYEPILVEMVNDKIAKENSDVVYFDNYRSFSEDQKTPVYPSRRYLKNVSPKEYIANTSGSLCMMCTRRSLWDGIKIPLIYNAEDIAVIPILLARAKKVSVIDIPLYNYFYRPASLSNSRKDVSESFLKAFDYIIQSVDTEKYGKEIEFQGIKTILYGATLNALQIKGTNAKVKKFIIDFEKDYPSWTDNPYIKELPGYKRIYLRIVRKKMVFLLRAYVSLHHFAYTYLKV